MFLVFFKREAKKACTALKADWTSLLSPPFHRGGLCNSTPFTHRECFVTKPPSCSLCKQSLQKGGASSCVDVTGDRAAGHLVGHFPSVLLCSREPLAFNSFLNVLAHWTCFLLIQEITYLKLDLGFKKVALVSCLVFTSSILLGKSRGIASPFLT